MAKELIIVDTCVLIRALRKDNLALTDLKEIMDRTAYSVITHLELLIGANTQTKKEITNKIIKSFYRIPLNRKISLTAIEIMQQYVSGNQIMSVPDCLIAATAIVTGYPLLTYNKKDFDFIRGMTLYK